MAETDRIRLPEGLIRIGGAPALRMQVQSEDPDAAPAPLSPVPLGDTEVLMRVAVKPRPKT